MLSQHAVFGAKAPAVGFQALDKVLLPRRIADVLVIIIIFGEIVLYGRSLAAWPYFIRWSSVTNKQDDPASLSDQPFVL